MTNDNDKTSETPVGESSNQNPDGSAKSGNANAYNTPEWAKPLMEALVAQGLTNQELLKLLTKKTDSSDAEVTDVLGAFTKPKKMPLASDRGSQVWSGTAETLDHCITWFEATAEEKGLPKTDWKAKWFDYVDAGHVERLKAMLIEETTWTAVKARLTTLYRDRSKDVEGTLEALQKYALTYQKKPLNRIEDLTARIEAYARDALKFQANMGINDYINQYWYEGLPRAWKDRYVEEVWRKETQDKTKYPDRKKVTKWIEGILDPRDVLENERIEEMHPELRTHQELAQLAEENKTRYLSKVQKGRTEIVQLKTTIDEEEMNPTKPTVGLSAPGNPVDEVDDLIKRMSDLKIQSASAAGITARQAATYSACYARLYVLRPRHAAQMPKTLAAYTATTPAIDTLLDEAWQMKDADRGGYRENPTYKELYERIHSISAVTAEGLLEPPREGTSTYKREVPPHYPSRTSRETAEPARPINSSYTRETVNRGPAKCHWCGSPAHRVAQCTVPEKWVPDNILAKINNLWVWKANGLPIKRHTDGTYESTVREMVEAAKERIQTAEAAAVMGYESTDFDDSMYPPGMEEAQQSAYSSFAIISLDLESQDVVDDDGEVCQDTLWGRTAAEELPPFTACDVFTSEARFYNLQPGVDYGNNYRGDRPEDQATISMLIGQLQAAKAQDEAEDSYSVHAAVRSKHEDTRTKPYRSSSPTPAKTPLGQRTPWEKRQEIDARKQKVAEIREKKPWGPTNIPFGSGRPLPAPVALAPPKRLSEDIDMAEPITKPAVKKELSKKVTFQEKDHKAKLAKTAVSSIKSHVAPTVTAPKSKASSALDDITTAKGGSKYTYISQELDAGAIVKDLLMKRTEFKLTFAELCAISPLFAKAAYVANKPHQMESIKRTLSAEINEGAASEASDEESSIEDELVYKSAAVSVSHVTWSDRDYQESISLFEAHEAETQSEKQEVVPEHTKLVTEPAASDGSNKPVDLAKKPPLTTAWGTLIEADAEYLAVGTCKMKSIIGGVPAVAMIDDGSELNIIPEKLWDLVNAKEPRGLRTDTVFRVNGILGAPEALLGSVVLPVTLGGITTTHTFWVGSTIKKVILGMPFVYKNKIDIYWAGERRVVRQNTPVGQSHQYMHLPQGPKKTQYDVANRLKVVEKDVNLIGALVEVHDIFVGMVSFSQERTEPGDMKYVVDSLRPAELDEEANWVAEAIGDYMFKTGSIDGEGFLTLSLNDMYMVDHLKEGYERMELFQGTTGSAAGTYLSCGAYKPVAKKKRPVETIYPEVEKDPMVTPGDLMADLPVVTTQPMSWEDLRFGDRLTKERMIGIFNQSPEGFLLPVEKDLIASVLLQQENALAWTEAEKGCFSTKYIPPHRIPLIPHVPWQDKVIRIPAKTREKVIAFMKEKLKSGLYERSQSSYRSAFFPVEKKDGNVRVVHDLQNLNMNTVRDAGMPPNMDDLTESLVGRSVYTQLDAFAGYDQLELHKDSRDVTTFESPLGTLRLTKMRQGWTNAVAAFHRVMAFIFADELPDKVQVYIDDVTLKGPSSFYLDKEGRPETIPENKGIRRFIYEHFCDLNIILHKMKRYGGTFSAKKLQLAVPEVLMVGYMCSFEGRRVTKEAMAKIDKWTVCHNKKDVRSVLGVLGRARMWIRNYGQIVRPMVDLTKVDGSEFAWTADAAAALEAAKEAFRNCGVIRPIDYSVIDKYPPILAIDASYMGCGIELAQMDAESRRQPARFMTVYYNEMQQRYSQPKLELYGIFVGMKVARPWVHGCKFILETDCSSVKQMINAPSYPSAAEGRWCMYILSNHFEFKHVPGTTHIVPDALSRRPQQDDDSDDEDLERWLDDRYDDYDVAASNVQGEAEAVANAEEPGLDSEDEAAEADAAVQVELSRDDDRRAYDRWDGQMPEARRYSGDWWLIARFLATLEWPADIEPKHQRKLARVSRDYFLRRGLLFKKPGGGHCMPARVILNKTAQMDILRALHDEGGHRGERGTYTRIRDRFYWPGMARDIEGYVRSCVPCQQRDYRFYESPKVSPEPPTILYKWDIDCISMGKDPKDTNQPQIIVIARENTTGWVEARALRSTTASEVAKFFYEDIISRYGTMVCVTTDGGSEFKGDFHKLLQKFQVKHIVTSSYNPAANGVIERGNRPIKEAIFKRCPNGQTNRWPDYLHYALWADRTTVRASTGYTPHYLMFGQEAVLPIDFTEESILMTNWEKIRTPAELLEARMIQIENREADKAVARERVKASREASVAYHNDRFSDRQHNRDFKSGDLVMVRNSQQDNGRGVRKEPRWRGPYRIVRINQGGAFILREITGALLKEKIPGSRIRRFYKRPGMLDFMMREAETSLENDRAEENSDSE